MTENIATTVLNIHKSIQKKLEGLPYEAFIEDDGGGPYIGLYNPDSRNKDSDYLCLSLFSGKIDSLADYRWHFWDNNMNVWLTSDLDWQAPEEEVLAFLQEGIRKVG